MIGLLIKLLSKAKTVLDAARKLWPIARDKGKQAWVGMKKGWDWAKGKFSKAKIARTKGCATQACRDALNKAQKENLKRFEDKLPKDAKTTQIRDGPNGQKIFEAEVPGQVPGSSAVYQKTVDAAGNTVGYTKITFDPSGAIAHIKNKL